MGNRWRIGAKIADILRGLTGAIWSFYRDEDGRGARVPSNVPRAGTTPERGQVPAAGGRGAIPPIRRIGTVPPAGSGGGGIPPIRRPGIDPPPPPDDKLSFEEWRERERRRWGRVPWGHPGRPDPEDAGPAYQRSFKTKLDNVLWVAVQSSNIEAIGYDDQAQTLFVRFHAATLSASARVTRSGRVRGRPGRTLTGRRSSSLAGRGMLYEYRHVPRRVFERLSSAASVGSEFWDLVRVRGSRWRHRYKYDIVTAGMVETHDGGAAAYVPRRVTRHGYRQRRQFADELGRTWNSSIRPRRGTPPDRGTPVNRGTTP